MKPTGHVITEDKSRFTHGAFYHAFYDRRLAAARTLVVDLVSEGSTVLDMASGTGELCFDLVARRNCQVVGVDLSRRMVEFAEKRNQDGKVRFVHGDATNLADLESGTFDYATLLFLLHEVPRQTQVALLKEALRVARQAVIVDSRVPLPWNLHGIALRMVELSGGPEHYRSFANYLAAGGIGSILADSRVRASVARRSVFWYGCRELVVLDRQPQADV